jgi:hypothetical protein
MARLLKAGRRKEVPVRTHLALAVLIVLAAPRIAEARQYHFLGGHPIAARFGGGYCYIETPHIHSWGPDRTALYGDVGGQLVFTGDPTPFGYDGEKYTYYGHHPIVSVGGEPVYCYIDGPHYHGFPPPDTNDYRTKSGVAFYVGPFSPGYVKMKPHREKIVNAEYRPYVEFRPTVQVEPPPEWHGEVVLPGPPSVTVGAPGVVVAPPHPRVEVYAPGPPSVTVTAPGVVVAPPPEVVFGAPAPTVVVAPPVPHVVVAAPVPHVVVAAPAPRVVVGAPAPVVVAPAPVVVGAPVYRVREHHDNGRHEGWYKHDRGDDDDQGRHHGRGHD